MLQGPFGIILLTNHSHLKPLSRCHPGWFSLFCFYWSHTSDPFSAWPWVWLKLFSNIIFIHGMKSFAFWKFIKQLIRLLCLVLLFAFYVFIDAKLCPERDAGASTNFITGYIIPSGAGEQTQGLTQAYIQSATEWHHQALPSLIWCLNWKLYLLSWLIYIYSFCSGSISSYSKWR